MGDSKIQEDTIGKIDNNPSLFISNCAKITFIEDKYSLREALGSGLDIGMEIGKI